MGKIGREWQDTDSVLSYFGDERKNCVERYEKFVQRLLSEAEEKEKQSLRLITKIADLAFLAVQIAKGEGIDEALLRSGTRKRLVARKRKLFSQIAVGKLGYSGAEVCEVSGRGDFMCKPTGSFRGSPGN